MSASSRSESLFRKENDNPPKAEFLTVNKGKFFDSAVEGIEATEGIRFDNTFENPFIRNAIKMLL